MRSHSVRCCLTTRSDNEEVWDELTSKINRVVKHSDEMTAEAIRRAEEGCIETQASIANLHQHINMLRERCRKRNLDKETLVDVVVRSQ